ncbi:DUF4192 domain-containing protein [Nocardia sp. NPDC056064]|uniref:DUF4192 domain-containing protein n=1 Tax=Nocardia sp. NPDC056064 TaxID=3345701 RepID=UPI0035E22D2C
MTSSTNSPRRTLRTGPFPRALTCAESTPVYPGEIPRRLLRVADAGELIAALPAMLGFVPERSLVVAVLHGPGQVGGAAIEAVVRFDLDGAGDPRHIEQFTACVSGVVVREQGTGVLAIVVDDRAPSSAAALLRTAVLLDALGAEGIAVRGAWSVPAIAAGQRYRNLFEPGADGYVGDPAASMIAVSQVLDGRQIRRSRTELTALVAADELRCARLRPLLDPAVRHYRDRLAAAQRSGQGPAFQRRALEWVLWQIADTESGVPRDERELARLAATLRDRPIRDAMYGLALGDHAEAAEQLWAQLARATPGADRAEAAALLGFSAYLRGDGPFAGIALAAAVDADATHPMAVLLETSLQSGLRPESLRKLAHCGHQIAADLGVDIGPVEP